MRTEIQACDQELERGKHRFAIGGTEGESQRDEENAGGLPVVPSEDTEPPV